jgi:hypothetical protein
MFNKFSKTIMIASAVLTFSTASASAETPPMTGAIPATKVVTIVPGPMITTTTANVTETQITEKIKEVEAQTRRKVVFYYVPEGLNATNGCKKPVDPIKKGWIKANGKFKNTWLGNEIGWRNWKKGDKLCNIRISGKGKNKVITATIKRCGNKDVKIYFNQKMVKKQKILRITEFKSLEYFVQRYFKKTINTETTTQTTDEKITYTCPVDYIVSGLWCLPVKRNPDNGAGTGNSGTPSTGQPGSGSTGTPASADCWALDGNNDPTIPGRWTNGTCVRI